MSRKAFLVILAFVILSLGVSGCDPSPTTCDPGSLVSPELGSPDRAEVLNASAATLNWSYPDSCQPEQYEVIVSKEIDFTPVEHSTTVSGSTTTWALPTLDIAERYYWRVFPKVGATTGPPSILLKYFYTGPICDVGDLVPPNLINPPSGGIFYKAYSSLEWEWPLSTCIPEHYRVRVAPDPAFADTTYFGYVPNPSTSWGFGPTPPDATQFWWYIIPVVGGVDGPSSITWTFFTDPVCAGASLIAPDLIAPLDGDTVAIGNPEYSWDYPHMCAPEGFHLQISRNPDFSDLAMYADNPTHAASSFQAGVLLDDCDSYFWRVAVVSEGIQGPWSEARQFFIDTAGTCACDPGLIPVPDLIYPEFSSVIPGLDTSLEWYNPGDCFPDGWSIKLGYDSEYEDPGMWGAVPSYSGTSWGTGPLDPVEAYRWTVAGVVDSPPDTIIGDYALPSYMFFTGPECTSLAEVGAPIQIAPDDGAVVDTLYPILEIDYGDASCLPEGILYNLQTDDTFAGTNLLGDFTHPWDRVSPADPLMDCNLYYWYASFNQGGAYGPDSDTRSFFVDTTGACPAMPIPGEFKMNAFCRYGTFPEYWPDAIHLFLEGDPVWIIARNFFNTYLQVYVPTEDGSMPKEGDLSCWTIKSAIRLLKPKQEPEIPINNPPPTPKPTDTPPPQLICHAKLLDPDCTAAGGYYDTGQNMCICP